MPSNADGRIYNVPFSEITFTRDGDNLIATWIEEGEDQTYTYENFFTTKPVDTIYTQDGTYLTKHVMKTDAVINTVPTTAQYTGTEYNEIISAKKAESESEYYSGPNNAGSYIGTGDEQTRSFVSKIDGNAGNDVIAGTDGNDWLEGGEGNDTIYGGSGVDMIAGNAGNDTLVAGMIKKDEEGEEYIEYSTDNVEIYGDVGDDVIYSGKGEQNFIWAGEGNDTIYLNGGANTIVFCESDGGSDIVIGTTGADTLKLALNDGTSLKGFKFSDLSFTRYVDDKGNLTDDLIIYISKSKNTITIKDFFKGTKLSDNLDKIVVIDETDSTKQKDYSIINDAVITVSGVKDYNGYNVLDGETTVGYTETITATDDGATINGNLKSDKIYGGKGNDYLRGNEGDDTIFTGDDGKDYIYGDDGDDVLSGSKNNLKSAEIIGGAGNDTITSGSGNDYIHGGEGNDSIDLTNGGINNLVFIEENFGNDTVKGGQIDDTLTFAVKYRNSEGEKIVKGFAYTDLEFEIVENNQIQDLKITATHIEDDETETINTVLLKDYNKTQINNVIAFDENGELAQYSLLDFLAIDRGLTPNKKGVITGTKYADIISGVADKNNTVKSGGGNDLVTANSGNDKLYGGEGQNQFNFSSGDGKDTIYSDGGEDYLIFKGFEDTSSFYMAESGNNLIINYGESDKITMNNFLKGNHSVKGFIIRNNDGEDIYAKDLTKETIDISLELIDKKSFTGSKLAETIIGSVDNNTIKGGGGNDIIHANGGTNKIYTQSKKYDFTKVYAGTGNDTLNAGNGVDTFVFENGKCNDTVKANKNGSVVIDISSLSNVSFTENKKDLVITNTFGDVVETINLKNYLSGSLTKNVNITADAQFIYNLRDYLGALQAADKTTLTVGDKDSDKKQKINATFLDESIFGGSNNDTIKSGAGKDYITGNKGNDKIYGYLVKSDKKYIYDDTANAKEFFFSAKGDGKDTLYTSKNADRIIFTVDNSAEASELLSNLAFDKSGKNLVVSYKKDGTGKITDSVTIADYYKHDAETESLRYVDITDGTQTTTLDLAELGQANYIDNLISEVEAWIPTEPSGNQGLTTSPDYDFSSVLVIS